MIKDPIEELLLQVACIKAYFELMIPCFRSLIINLERIMADLKQVKEKEDNEGKENS